MNIQKYIKPNSVNIYTNPCFIPLPQWRSCPPPPQLPQLSQLPKKM